MNGMVPCSCGDQSCDVMLCVACGSDDCKWPGECYGRCAECGGPSPVQIIEGQGPFHRADGRGPWHDLYCGNGCMAASTARYEAAGEIIRFSDITPERANGLLNGSGLCVAGVGKVSAS